MNNIKTAVILAVALSLAVFLALPAAALVAVGDKAPDFELDNLNGKTVKLSDYMNKPTLLVFWVSWCPHCQAEVPVLQNVYSDLKAKGMNAVGVSVDRDIEDAREFVKEYKITFPNAHGMTDKGVKVLDEYGIEGVPTIYILDKTGTVRVRYVGEMPEEQVREEFAKLGVK